MGGGQVATGRGHHYCLGRSMVDSALIEWTGLIRVRRCCVFADVGTRTRVIEIRPHHCVECIRTLKTLQPPIRLLESPKALGAMTGPPTSSSVMVVDDDRDIREAISDTLTDIGCEVVQAGGGDEGLAYLRSSPRLPRLVFLDLLMAGMDGYQFRAEMEKDPRLAHIPVVVVTANQEDPNRLRGTPVLRKPVQLESVIGALQKYGTNAPS
jgi:CheY-like chemotaxis protein